MVDSVTLHLNGPIHMMTARKRVGPLPTHHLVVRHFADHSSSDSSSEASSDFHSDASSDPSLRHSLSDHSSPDLPNPEIQAGDLTSVIAYAGCSWIEGLMLGVSVGGITQSRDAIGYFPEAVMMEAVEATYEGIGKFGSDGSNDHTQAIQSTSGLLELGEDNRRLRDTGVKMPNTQSEASMTHEEFEELVNRRVAEEMEAREAARTLEPLNENEDELEGENGGNGNGGNKGNGNGGKGNRNKNHGMNYRGTEGVVRLTHWFEKMETVFNISNCPPKYQVKYATCTLQDSALTWWNSNKRTIGVEAAYAINWVELMKLMIEVYCLRNEIQKMETELWNLTVKGNDLTAYTQRFQELILLSRLQDAIRIANQLMDKKVQGYAVRSVENKRRMKRNLRDNHGQQPPFKRQNTSGQNVARAYTTGNNERKGYARPLPYCNKCRMYHEGLCTIRCRNYNKVGHQTRDCRAAIAPNTQRAPVGNQQGIICYECGRPRHFRKDCPKWRNQYRGNQTRNKNGNKTGNQTGGNETTARAYAIAGGGTNPDSNVVTGTFLLNNFYDLMLFDLGADRSFVSTTFSALLDVTPTTLDTSY
ncbi:putative reverse transcriptase domain-containing protein, partial [Tanacetum coccineum]